MGLELLSLLSVSGSSVFAGGAPVVSSDKDELRARRHLSIGGHLSSRSSRLATPASSQGARCNSVITREDVLHALSGISDAEEFFVYGFMGMLKEDSILAFEAEAFTFGLRCEGLFFSVSLDEFRPVWRQAWRAYMDNRTVVGVKTLAGLLGCSESKAKRLRPVFSESMQVIFTLEAGVCFHLNRQLSKFAA